MTRRRFARRATTAVAAAAGIALTLAGAFPAGARAEDPLPRFGFVGLHGGVFEQLKAFEQASGVRLDYLRDDALSKREVDLSLYAAVFVQHPRPEDRDAYRELIVAGRKKNASLRVLSLSGYGLELFRDEHGNALIEQDQELQRYYTSSRENLRRLIGYALARYAGRKVQVEPPEDKRVTFGLYHPDHEGIFEDVPQFLRWCHERGRATDGPRVAITAHSFHLEMQQPKVVDALIRAFEKHGVLAVALRDTAEGVDLHEKYDGALLEYKPGAVVHTCHSFDSAAFRAKLGVPHLHSVFFTRDSVDQWYASAEGLDANARAFQIAAQEILGAIEPQIGAGTHVGGSGEAFVPIDDRIDHLVRRTVAWVRLARKPNREKRVAIVYYDREAGKGEIMRGSATGMFLNGPRSCLKVLERLNQAGYSVSPLPADEKELVSWLMDRGRQVGIWAPGELDRLVRQGNPVLVPVAQYVEWLEKKVPPAQRRALEDKWGPPPGRFLAWENEQHEKFLVVPRIQLGNVVLLPQPLRGEAQDPNALLHDRNVPPPHNYLATYFWLQEEFRADALIHFGTHGSEIALPGKSAGLCDKDWSDTCLGALPNVNPWIVNNLGETSPAKRRAYAVLVSHLTPPLVNAELADELLNLHNDIDKWTALDAGALKEKFRGAITAKVRERKLDKDLHLDLSGDRLLTAEEIGKAEEYLHGVHNETMPIGLHVLGEAPAQEVLVPWLVSCLGKKFLNELGRVCLVPKDEDRFGGDRTKYLRKKAEEVVALLVRQGLSPLEAVRAVTGRAPDGGLPEGVEKGLKLALDLKERFGRTHEELDNLLAALDGKFVPAGPGNSPERNPGAVPTGRNLYLLNPDEVPSRPSWEIGKALVDQMLSAHRKKHGRLPEKVAFDLSSFATFQDYGVMEAQILCLLGVEPVWDEKNLVNDVRIVPREVLRRPRIDVFVSALAYYRDNLPTRMALLDKAIRRVADLEEEENGVRLHTLAIEKKLAARGVPEAKARALSKARVFGYPPGQYGSMAYYYLVERSGQWDTREQLVDAYLSQVSNVYTEGTWGEPAREAYEASIQGTDVVLRSWSDSTTSPLSNKYTWYMGGSLSLAVKHLTGKEPEYLLSDVRDPDQAKVVDSQDALRQELRVRLFNRKWIEALRKEGYAGADQVSKMVSNALGWKVVRDDSVGDDVWEEIKAVYVDDRLHLNVREWFESENPYAFQDVTEVLLEAARKGYWKADAATVRQVAELYASSVARHGEGGGLRGGGNVKLEAFVERALKEAGPAPGSKNTEGLLAEFRRRVREAAEARSSANGVKNGGTAPPAAPAAATPTAANGRSEAVRGRKLKEVNEVPDDPRVSERTALLVAAGLAIALVGYGFVRRRGAL